MFLTYRFFLMLMLSFSVLAVEVVKITPKAIDLTNTQLDIEFDGRMVTPPYFVPYKNSVAIKWENATLITGKNFLSQDFEIQNVKDALMIIYKRSSVSADDISKLSLKLAGKTVRTVLPMLPAQGKRIVPTFKIDKKDNDIEFNTRKTSVDGIHAIEKKSPELVQKDKTNSKGSEKEDYLSYLLSSVDKENLKKTVEQPALPVKKIEPLPKNAILIPKVEKNLESKEAKNFSSYILRIMVMLSFLIGAILLLAKISKKIMLGKNKLGFLNNSKVVEILNTTYIAPKRQLLLVKVHDQVMLLANAENGLSFISEVHDLSNLLKKAEVEVTGSNFDTNFKDEEQNESKVTLKDTNKLYESTPIENKNSKMRSVLKNKAKSFKAWQ